jgi:hypothetical protein
MIADAQLQQVGEDDDRVALADDDRAVSVAEAASLLGRDRTRVYACCGSRPARA